MAVEGKYVFKLDESLRKKAEKELFETDESRDVTIPKLRQKVEQNKALECPTNDEFLLRFLRARKFDVERSYTLLENYYKIRAENADRLSNLFPSTVEHIWDDGVIQVLPKRDHLGRTMIYFRPGRWRPSVYPVYDILRGFMMSLEIAIQDEETQISGIVMLGNGQDSGLEQLRNLSRDYFRLSSSFMQDSFPVRIKAIQFVNESSVIGYIFEMVKLFMREKLKNRLNFHGPNLQALQDVRGFPVEVLPEELGGKLPSGDELAKEWKKKIMGQEDYFKNISKNRLVINKSISNQTKASKSDVTPEAVTGTFKKLNVD